MIHMYCITYPTENHWKFIRSSGSPSDHPWGASGFWGCETSLGISQFLVKPSIDNGYINHVTSPLKQYIYIDIYDYIHIWSWNQHEPTTNCFCFWYLCQINLNPRVFFLADLQTAAIRDINLGIRLYGSETFHQASSKKGSMSLNMSKKGWLSTLYILYIYSIIIIISPSNYILMFPRCRFMMVFILTYPICSMVLEYLPTFALRS